MSENNPPTQSSGTNQGFSIAFKAFLVGLLRLLIILIFGVVIGIAIYLGIPQLYRSFIQPVRDNSAQIAELKSQQQQSSDQFSQRIDGLQSRLDAMEIQQDNDREAIAELQTELEHAQQILSELSDSLTADAQNLASLESDLDDLRNGLDQANTSLSELDSKIDESQESIQSLSDFLASQETPVAALRRELQLVKAMELLTRSRLFLARNNFGLAQDDIQSARAILVELQTLVLPYQEETLGTIVSRIDLALENLDENSALAVEDLEVAWRLLVGGLPDEPPITDTGTALTPAATSDSSITGATPTITATPSVMPEETITPTPTSTP